MLARKVLFLILPLLLLAWTCWQQPQSSVDPSAATTNTPFDMETEMDKWTSMWNTYDLSMVDSLFLTNDRVTYFSSEKEGLITGIEAVKEHHIGFGFVPGGKIHPNRLWLEELNAQSFGEVTTVAGIWFFETVDGENTEISKGPVTFVYLLTESGYRIAHVHFANYPGNE